MFPMASAAWTTCSMAVLAVAEGDPPAREGDVGHGPANGLTDIEYGGENEADSKQKRPKKG